MGSTMHLPFLTLLIFSANYISIYAEEISTNIPNNATEEPTLRVRSLPMTINVVEKNWTSLSEMLDVFSARNLVRNWIEGKYPVGVQCGKDITTYIDALKNEELWALKVDDASGRFTNGFFWGNTYFTGSATECDYIGTDWNPSYHTYSKNHIKDPKVTINTGLSGASTWSTDSVEVPFQLGFYMLKLSVNVSCTPTKLIHLGVCLPFSCTASDVAVIGKLAASEFAAKHSTIEKVRDQHTSYDMYTDPVFWVLFGVSIVVLILMILGTGYDYYLSKKAACKSNVIYDLEKHGKLDHLTNGDRKVINAVQGEVYLPVPVADSNSNGVQSINNNNGLENGLQPSTKEEQHLSIFEELLLSFSVPANMKIICDRNVGSDTISTVHGLRAISMAWVILGHTCIIVFKYSDNMEYRKVVEKRFLFQTITNGAFSVDTFFFMGGLLVSFLYFRTNAKGDLKRLTQGTRGFAAGTLKFIGLLVYRFCRLTTPYMFILGVVEISMKYFYTNSVFEPPTADHYNCPNYWWRNLLYINTWFPVDQMCMLWSWYLADDTQFYIVGGVILILATNHFKIAASALVGLLVSSWITTGYIALVNNHMPSMDDPLALFDKIYDKPWTRLGPYLIGMSVGYFLFKTDCKVKMSKTTVVVGWLLSSACLLSLLYGLYEAELTPVTGAVYSSLSHSAWALGLAWIVIACSTGYGGYVNKILSWPLLYPFSRVTYCSYLIHPLVIRLTAMNLDSPFHLGKDIMMITFLGQLSLSYALSFIVSIAFEAPVVSMLKIVSPKKRKRIQ
ncbi:PREDICTED: nose resistant to fluoxetine protein 6-like isoform X1 [Acromyrmex echinatior]|uniref:nose resistant to fluoxetine protein 6-like isoform X1 n=1 Tax=Acromyrmex echinatior TaxID=103372 RepID=UPI000580BDDB|nr:PREDICTED: nose resistant to fluoxetine protein 6-like isoform X1 [Acromyrmex echinatior]